MAPGRVATVARPGAAAIAVILVAALAWAFVGDRSGDPGGSAVVPYVANEFEPPAQYVTLDPAPAELPACTPEQLTLEDAQAPPGSSDPSLGQAGYFFQFRNGGSGCALGDGPEVTLTSPSATADPLTARRVPQTASTGGMVTSRLPSRWAIDPDQRVNVSLIFSGAACVHFSEDDIRVQISDAGVDYANVMLPEPTCPLKGIAGDILDSTLWTPYFPEPAEDTNVFEGRGLVATLDVPDTVPADQDIEYTVTLSNPTDSDIPLEPCPRYRQAAGEGAFVSESHGELNCEAAPPAVPAQGEIVFQMRLRLPEEFTPGFAGSVLWSTYPNVNADLATENPSFTVVD